MEVALSERFRVKMSASRFKFTDVMTAIALLLLVISFSLLITRTAAAMLQLTGMSKDSARFQARAAFCGVGYSGTESEGIMNHPLRRQIISTLMLLGNAGTATVVATLILSFSAFQTYWLVKLGVLMAGVGLLAGVASSRWFDTYLTIFIAWALKKYTRLDLHDYVALLNLSKGYAVLELEVASGDWMGGSNLASLALAKEGVLVLGVEKPDGRYIGAPSGDTRLDAGDMLTLYGKLDRLEELNRRRIGIAGVYAHAAAVSERSREAAEEGGSLAEDPTAPPAAESTHE